MIKKLERRPTVYQVGFRASAELIALLVKVVQCREALHPTVSVADKVEKPFCFFFFRKRRCFLMT